VSNLGVGSIDLHSYEITGNPGNVLSFVSAPPTDGSVLLAQVTVDSLVGSFGNGRQHALIIFRGGSSAGTATDYTPEGEGAEPSDLPVGWFIL